MGAFAFEGRFAECVARFTERVSLSEEPKELAMADVAFVLTTVAVFALVALIAKGVAKL